MPKVGYRAVEDKEIDQGQSRPAAGLKLLNAPRLKQWETDDGQGQHVSTFRNPSVAVAAHHPGSRPETCRNLWCQLKGEAWHAGVPSDRQLQLSLAAPLNPER